MSAVLPTATNFPSRIATASASSLRAFKVMIFPLYRIRSGAAADCSGTKEKIKDRMVKITTFSSLFRRRPLVQEVRKATEVVTLAFLEFGSPLGLPKFTG